MTPTKQIIQGKKKIKFWDKGSRQMLESPTSCARAFGNLLETYTPPGFSDCDNTPEVNRYIPLTAIGKTDCKGVELWEGDIVNLDYSMFRGDSGENTIPCVVTYDSTEAIFCISPLDNTLDVSMLPLWGLNDEIEAVGNIYQGLNTKRQAR